MIPGQVGGAAVALEVLAPQRIKVDARGLKPVGVERHRGVHELALLIARAPVGVGPRHAQVQLLRQHRPALIVVRERGEHAVVVEELLQHLRGRFDEVPLDVEAALRRRSGSGRR